MFIKRTWSHRTLDLPLNVRRAVNTARAPRASIQRPPWTLCALTWQSNQEQLHLLTCLSAEVKGVMGECSIRPLQGGRRGSLNISSLTPSQNNYGCVPLIFSFIFKYPIHNLYLVWCHSLFIKADQCMKFASFLISRERQNRTEQG